MAEGSAPRMVPRLMPPNPESEMVALWAMLYAIPRNEQVLERVNAFAVFGGMGETWRVAHAIKAFQRESNDINSVLLIAGTGDDEKTYDRLTPERLEQPPYNLNSYFYEDIFFVQEDIPKNTIDQCEWVAKMVGERKLESVALFASPYHLVRAWSTLLKTFMKHGIRIPIIPVPTSVSPSVIVPEDGQDAWAHVAGEIERIKKYREKGDVATFEEAMEFINWMWAQPPLAAISSEVM